MNPLYIFYSVLAVASGVLILDQIWLGVVEPEIFWKVMITICIVGGVVLAIQLIRNEVVEEKKQKDDGYVD
ncbi:MAG: hypothetical protein COV35_08970 [Alphaproteobacteria bacterium CG11_big_fil_rev_8_21_14_0_20_39_49]|nr:MAG: hypothetical protein COV35_08970 [Alphaproteobacteria bacterium CG11_big_fil_rev_8_21_14_0_20_39_49]